MIHFLRPRKPARRVLAEREARILQALGETVFPDDGSVGVSVDEAALVEYLDRLLLNVPIRERVMVRGMLWLFELQTFATRPLALSRFSRASFEDRLASLQSWDESDLYFRRAAMQALRGLLLWAYVDNPSVQEAMGVEPGTDIIARETAAVAQEA